MITPFNCVSASPRYVPIELYPLIFQHITHAATLSELCTISRAFRYEAERVLYHTIHLPNTYGHIFSWCRVIVEIPRFAKLVHSLTLPTAYEHLGWPLEGELAELQLMVNRALSSLSALSELYTYYSSGRTYLFPDIFRGRPFRLRVFENGLRMSDNSPTGGCHLNNWIGFISEQPGIQHWRPNLDHDVDQSLAPDVLPSLTSARVRTPLLDILAPRPIRALHISECCSVKFLADLSVGLEVFTHTLTNLYLRMSKEDTVHASEVLKTLSDVVPNLKFLGLEARVALFNPSYPNEPSEFFSALSDFPHLEVLILELPPYNPMHLSLVHGAELPHSDDEFVGLTANEELQPEWVDSRPDSEAQALWLANALMEANRSVKRIVFDVKGAWAGEKLPCYFRVGSESGLNGVAVLKGFDMLHPDSWRYF